MHLRQYLGIREAMAAVKAIMAEADRVPGRPISAVVVDHRGDLLCLAAMGGGEHGPGAPERFQEGLHLGLHAG